MSARNILDFPDRHSIYGKASNHIGVRRGHAEQIRSTTAYVERQLAQIAPDLKLDNSRIKDFDRACRKAACPDRDLHDLLGSRYTFETSNTIHNLRGLMNRHNPIRKALAEKGIEIIKVDDYHRNPKPHGYMAMHVDFRVKNAGAGGKHWSEDMEWQFMHRLVRRAESHTRPFYDVMREAKEYACIRGRREPGQLKPAERVVIGGLQNYINATFEGWGFRAGIMGLREDTVYGSEREAFDGVQKLSREAGQMVHLYETYDRDIEALFGHYELLTGIDPERQDSAPFFAAPA